jgi:hypothetical protein
LTSVELIFGTPGVRYGARPLNLTP